MEMTKDTTKNNVAENILDEMINEEVTTEDVITETNSCQLKKRLSLSKKEQRSLCVTGMATSMAVTAVTGFVSGRYAKHAHIASGLALIGFSAWHYCLNTPKKKK